MSKLSAVFLLTLLAVHQVQEVSARSSFMRSQVDPLSQDGRRRRLLSQESQDGRRRRREMERDVPTKRPPHPTSRKHKNEVKVFKL